MSSPTLSEDDIDDLLYFARTNDTSELATHLTALSSQTSCSEVDIFITARDPDTGNTVAHYAAANGFDDLLKWLITRVQPPSTPSSTQLDTPAEANGTATVTAAATTTKPPPPPLLTQSNDAGSTPLHYAAMTGALACVRVLVEAGVAIRTRNGMGRTAIYEAEMGGKEEVVAYLLGVAAIEVDADAEEEEGGTEEVDTTVNGKDVGIEKVEEGKVEDGEIRLEEGEKGKMRDVQDMRDGVEGLALGGKGGG